MASSLKTSDLKVAMYLANLAGLQDVGVSHNQNIRKKVLISPNTIHHLVYLSHAVFPPGETAETHNHQDMTEIFYISSGSAQITVDGKDFECPAGSCIAIEPHEQHRLSNTSNDDLVILYLGLQA